MDQPVRSAVDPRKDRESLCRREKGGSKQVNDTSYREGLHNSQVRASLTESSPETVRLSEGSKLNESR